MEFSIFGFIVFIGVFIGYMLFKRNKEQKRIEELNEWDRQETYRMQNVVSQRLKELKEKPIKCNICSKKKGKRVNFKGLACFHCPKCGKHGLPSIYENTCTMCANRSRGLN